MPGARFFPTIDPKQAHRLRRWLMAAAASGMVIALFAAAYVLDVLPMHAFFIAAGSTAIFVAAFYIIFRTGFNKRFRDQSLTLPQIICSTVVILYVLYQTPNGHGILVLVYLVSFIFGVFRLTTRQLLALTAFVVLSYALIIWAQWHAGVASAEINPKILNWIVFATVLTYFSIMGGYISRLRENLQNSKVNLERALAHIEHLAARDELTGVLNRRSLIEALVQHKNRADRFGTPFSVLLLDIDLFKRVNDTYGHQAGDLVLKSFARAAAACVRATDTFGRYGGEEFLAILEQTTLDRTPNVADRICESTRQLVLDEIASGFHISVSVGASQYKAAEDWQATIERADRALYRAKANGRDRFEFESNLAITPAGNG